MKEILVELMIENRLLKKSVLADGEDMSKSAKKTDMVDVVGKAIAVADGGSFAADRARYRRLAVAAIRPLAKPTEAMVDAAHEAVWFDAYWAINSRQDFKWAVKAMIAEATRGAPD